MRKINLLCLFLFGMKQVLSKPILFSLCYYISYVIALISEINVLLSILFKNDDRKLHPSICLQPFSNLSCDVHIITTSFPGSSSSFLDMGSEDPGRIV